MTLTMPLKTSIAAATTSFPRTRSITFPSTGHGAGSSALPTSISINTGTRSTPDNFTFNPAATDTATPSARGQVRASPARQVAYAISNMIAAIEMSSLTSGAWARKFGSKQNNAVAISAAPEPANRQAHNAITAPSNSAGPSIIARERLMKASGSLPGVRYSVCVVNFAPDHMNEVSDFQSAESKLIFS